MAPTPKAVFDQLFQSSQTGNYVPFFSTLKAFSKPPKIKPLVAPVGGAGSVAGASPYSLPPGVKANSPLGVIIQNAHKFGLDPVAVVAYALEEGGVKWGAVGDQGTSFGPFQAHIGGVAGSRSPAAASAWANSPAGLIQMMRMMSQSGARGLTGAEAAKTIELRFGRGANPPETVRRALALLPQAQRLVRQYRPQIEAASRNVGVPASNYPLGKYPNMIQGGKSPFSNLTFAGQADFVHVDTQLLGKLNALGKMLGVTIRIISGYRSPAYSANVGGYATDPHTRGVAVDAYINGTPIGDYKNAFKILKQLGLESGATPGFYRGKRDPEHVQIPGSGINKRIHAKRTLRR